MTSFATSLNILGQYFMVFLYNLANLECSIFIKEMSKKNFSYPFVLSLSKDMNGSIHYFNIIETTIPYFEMSFFLFNDSLHSLKFIRSYPSTSSGRTGKKNLHLYIIGNKNQYHYLGACL